MTEARKYNDHLTRAARSEADLLTIAYMALGFGNFCQAYRAEHGFYPEWNGHLEAMDEMIGFALLADQVADCFDEEGHPGVWLYEIAEPFGEALARCIFDGSMRACCAKAQAGKLLRDLMVGMQYSAQAVDAALMHAGVSLPVCREPNYQSPIPKT
ncbi:hypothetical protein [Parachitinimonas caeni]|uniref:Uncharacterized protein n=1 Tax=Parachitinimonas caeni TaxID=3031301 RepID=A0ABT7E310_9NEIS|nr:hypothetical protein [Parachitinimonas caeni]MDK2126695.1 hypothetical protein [Parachitinimonas caeni]